MIMYGSTIGGIWHETFKVKPHQRVRAIDATGSLNKFISLQSQTPFMRLVVHLTTFRYSFPSHWRLYAAYTVLYTVDNNAKPVPGSDLLLAYLLCSLLAPKKSATLLWDLMLWGFKNTFTSRVFFSDKRCGFVDGVMYCSGASYLSRYTANALFANHVTCFGSGYSGGVIIISSLLLYVHGVFLQVSLRQRPEF